MANNQELVKWMTETREGLTFASKVQLIKDYWDRKEDIEWIKQNYGNGSIKVVVEKLQQELDKALEILNKPKTEMGTQTEIEWREMDNLELKIASLIEKDLELTELQTEHAKLAPYFQKLGLEKTWEYLNNICLDYFAGILSELEEAERERERESWKYWGEID